MYVPLPQLSDGIYKILTVTDLHHLTVDGSPPDGSATFRVVSALGVSEKSLTDLFAALKDANTFVLATSIWDIIISPLSVVPDSHAFAQGLTSNLQVDNRYSIVTGRQTQVSNTILQITATLDTSDRLYDSRFVWISSRIDLETGILVKQQRAVANRIKAQQDILNSMLKLLAVQ